MKKRLEKLLAIKSIVTILVILVFCFLALTGRIETNVFVPVVVTIIGFYFGSQKINENKGE